MARLIIGDGVNTEHIIVLSQLFAFGSIVLHANPTGHLDQVDSFAPEHQIRFGNLEYVADARGDLIFTGFSALPEAPKDPEASTSESLSGPTPGPALTSCMASSLEVISA